MPNDIKYVNKLKIYVHNILDIRNIPVSDHYVLLQDSFLSEISVVVALRLRIKNVLLGREKYNYSVSRISGAPNKGAGGVI